MQKLILCSDTNELNVIISRIKKNKTEEYIILSSDIGICTDKKLSLAGSFQNLLILI